MNATGLNFAALDVETANSRRGSVCAIGLSVARDGAITERRSWLCKPPPGLDHFDGFNMSLHGITPKMVVGQPTFAERLEQLLELIGDLPVVAHNAGFDMGAVREACTFSDHPWPTLEYGCTLVMARRSLDLISYRLPLVADALGVRLEHHHDAGDDAAATAAVALALAQRHSAGTLAELGESLRVLLGQMTPVQWVGCHRRDNPSTGSRLIPRPAANPDADPTHPLYGAVIAFTGALSIVRAEAWRLVTEVGAEVVVSPNRRTNFLVIGDGFRGDNPSDFWSGKARKAVDLRAKGYPVEVLTEIELIQLIADPGRSGSSAQERVGAERT
ncbi:MAG TPA: exonuclease domain-containing protein [Sporichthyaceae bacterium]|jgi:DNA polymerase-3 subunit epsilon|nr:exonuclease domain-containing protein [Sporichthyaceae bacterium]